MTIQTDEQAPARTLSDIHRDYLTGNAITDAVIEAQGIYSDGASIMFPWREDDKLTLQSRPWPGNPGEYYWVKDDPLHLNLARESEGPEEAVLLCEGTKQHLAVASWAPPQYAVYGMPGCRGWMTSAGRDLSRFAGRRVLIFLDADAADNLDVWEGGEGLAVELGMENAASAEFVPSLSWGKDGIDDYLKKISAERRTDRITKLIALAQARPADRKPTKRKAQAPQTDRPLILVDGDRRDVIRQIMAAMLQRWDGTALFCYGGVLTRLREAKTEPLGKGAFLRWLSEAVSCFRGGGLAGYQPSWPDQQTVEALMASADEFMPLDQVTTVPFIRADGTVCAKNGYDHSSRAALVTGNSGMDRLDIPDCPSAADAAAAARYLLDEWLGDFCWQDESSRASALALVLTPFIRGLVPLVPLAVISGLQPGVGKGLLADCIQIMITGEAAPALPWMPPKDDDENRKQITAAFRGGSSLMWFDEAHQIESPNLSRAITSLTYADRILGVSVQAAFPNRVTWLASGNNVDVNTDMARRVHWIKLHPDMPDPENRPEEDFDHPHLRDWTAANRPELVTAALVVIRAWYAAGKPSHHRGSRMGSFERWDEIMSGILAYAGVPGFLGNLAATRAERDTSSGYWNEHLTWLRTEFGYAEFTVLQVISKAQASSGTWDAPPGLDDLQQRGYARNLGGAYGKNKDRWFGQLKLVKTGTGHRTVAKWAIQEITQDSNGTIATDLDGRDPGGIILPAPANRGVQNETPYFAGNETHPDLQESKAIPSLTCAGGMEGSGGISTPQVHAHAGAHDARAHTHAHERGDWGPSASLHPSQPGLSLGFDLETADAGKLFTYRSHDDRGFVRLAGLAGPSGTPVITSAPGLLPVLAAADRIDGHNILGFDLLALAWHHGADWESFAARARDTELIARQAWPPRSRETHSEDKLGLDNVAELLGLPGKTDDLRRLARQHGGYDQIPLDDPEYLAYLEGDLRATAAVSARLCEYYDTDPYLPREHKLASLAGRMSLNGFAVDQDLLARRLAEGEERKRQALQVLHEGWGLPLGKTVSRGRGKAKHEEWEEAVSPLSTDYGRDWLAGQWERYQVPDPPRTDTGKLALGAEELKRIAGDPVCPPDLRAMLAMMAVVTTTRTVYQTAQSCLAADGRVHPSISMRQSSGRWSTTNPGLTVFGKHGGRHVERDVFVPDEGHVLFSCDLSQVDMRGIAGHCQDPAYMEMFAPGQDAHEQIAAQVGLTRQQAKAIGHGWNYGLGAPKMIESGMDPDVVYRFTSGMEARFPRLMSWREEIRARARAGEILDNGFGRRMSADPARAYTVAPALMGQGTAGDIMKEVLIRLDERAPGLRPYYRVMVHDEQVFSVPKEDVEDAIMTVKEAFTWEWRGVPILCDINGPGDSWGAISAK